MEQAGFRKGYGTGDQIVNVSWVTERTRKRHKNVCCISYSNAVDNAEQFKMNNMRSVGVLIYLIILIRDVYTEQEDKVEFEQDITMFSNPKRCKARL